MLNITKKYININISEKELYTSDMVIISWGGYTNLKEKINKKE